MYVDLDVIIGARHLVGGGGGGVGGGSRQRFEDVGVEVCKYSELLYSRLEFRRTILDFFVVDEIAFGFGLSTRQDI